MSDSLANRVGILESQIAFLMNNMRMRAMIETGLIDPTTGKPTVKVVDGCLLDHWKMHQANALPPETPPADPVLPAAEVN